MSDNENIKKLNDEALEEVSGGNWGQPQYNGFYTYYVQPGNTFKGIADYFHVPMAYLGQVNNIPYPYYIRVGQELLIPKNWGK